MNTTPLENAEEKMRKLISENIVEKMKNENEAKTRLLIVNRILNILGWSENEYNPEKRTSTEGYTDYILSIQNINRLIVEAKRIGSIAPLEKNIQQDSYTNNYLFNHCGPEMKLLIDQCLSYCTATGIPYAVATTGNIWIILHGPRQGIEWGTMKAFVFNSLEDIIRRFDQFYGLISRESVKNHSLEQKFAGMVLIKPSIAIYPHENIDYFYQVEKILNKRIIEEFFNRFMGDITRNDQNEMLEYCYVENSELTEFTKDIQKLLQYDATLDENFNNIEDIDAKKLEDELEFQISSGDPKTILLVGNVGSGKSTFVHRFINYESRPKNNVCVVINLINESNKYIEQGFNDEQNLSDLIIESISKEFNGKFNPFEPAVIRKCFNTEISRFRKINQTMKNINPNEYDIEEAKMMMDLIKDKYKHLSGYIRYILKSRYKIWIIFDNVDRGTDSYQKFIYSFSHSLSSLTGCVTLITLREDTFIEAQTSGFLDVRNSDVIYRINAPEFKQIVSKRRNYIDKLIQQNKLPKVFNDYKELLENISWHIKQLITTDDKRLRLMIVSLTMNNIRACFSLLKAYYLSIHSKFHEYNNIPGMELKNIKINFADEYNRFIQSMMINNEWSYRESESEIINLFSVDKSEKTSHFLLIRIIAYMEKMRTINPKPLIKYINIMNDFILIGYQRHQINNALRRLLSDKIIISPSLPVNENKILMPEIFFDEMKFSLSIRGKYYMDYIISNEYYQSRVGEDTYWYNDDLSKKYISALEDSVLLQENHLNTDAILLTNARDVFIEYLKISLHEERNNGIIKYIQKEWALFIENILEIRVFGEVITRSIKINTDKNILNNDLFNNENVSIPIENSGQNQIKMFDFTDYEKIFEECVESIGFFPDNIKYKGSTYVIRVLWALELALRAGFPSQKASKIAYILNKFGKEKVSAPNVAKFFRHQRISKEYVNLWIETNKGYFSISSAGRKFLLDFKMDII